MDLGKGRLDAKIDAFAAHLVGERHASPHTVKAYRRDLEQLMAFLHEDLGREVRLADVTRLSLRGWLARLSEGRSPTSLARKLAAVRSFFDWLERDSLIAENPARLLAMPRIRRKMPTFLGVDAAAEVMRAPLEPSKDHARDLRDAAMLELLYGSGIRLSELVGLDLGDVSDDSLRVLGKGRKERLVPLGRVAQGALARYVARRGELAHPRTGTLDPSALFLGDGGRRLGARRVQTLCRRYGALGAGRPDLHPHALRHSCATHMLEGGADLRVIQEMLGHVSLSTTQRYTHVTLDQIERVYDAAHPLARRKAVSGSGPRGGLPGG